MIFHDVSQKSPEWFNIRLGLATASSFDKIVTPAKFDLSASASLYANQLISEMVTGEPAEKFETYAMERGGLLEPEAAEAYKFLTGNDLLDGGFLTNDDMTIGASPDGRVVDSSGKVVGGIEIKCPLGAGHIQNMLRGGKIDPSYRPQIQGQILIGGFQFIDFFSYHPAMPPVLIRTERDNECCEKLEFALSKFMTDMQEKIEILKRQGIEKFHRPILDFHKKQTDDNHFLMAG